MPTESTALQVIPEATMFDRGWRFLMNQLIQDVPESIAVCEFDCRDPNCSAERWLTCDRASARLTASPRTGRITKSPATPA